MSGTQVPRGAGLAGVGTTPMVSLDKPNSRSLSPGEGYFRVRLHSAQAVFDGGLWRAAEQLVVTSNVELHSPPFDDAAVSAIHRVGRIQSGVPEQLGLTHDLVDLVPATMERLTVAVDFLVDTKSRFAPLLNVVNSGAFSAVVSFAPGGVAVAKSLTAVSKALAQELLGDDAQQPILRFVADLSVVSGEVSDSYRIFLGSRSTRWPLPRPLPSPEDFEVRAGDLLLRGVPVTQWSYVVLGVDTVGARTRELGRAEAWYAKLNQVDVQVDDVADNPFASDGERRASWEKCRGLLKEAHVLLLDSPVYLRSEATSIIRTAYAQAHERLFAGASGSLGAPAGLSREDLELLAAASDQEVRRDVESYMASHAEGAKKLVELGLWS